MLETERDADDGDAADKTEDEVRRGDLPPPQQDPKHIHEYAEAASGVVSVHNLGSEWHSENTPNFHNWQPNGIPMMVTQYRSPAIK